MTDRMILGEDTIFSTDSELTGINNNAIIVGSSGCGKTMSFIEPRLLDTEKSSLVVTRTARNISERLNVPLDEVLYMPVGQVIIFRRGQKPIAFRQRYDILHDKRYQKVTTQYEKTIASNDDR